MGIEGFSIAFNILFGMGFLASSFVIFLINERSSRAKHCQFVSGVRIITFWASTFCWDFINFLLPCLLLMLVFWAFGVEALIGDGRVFSILLLFLLYGWAILPCMYIFSFLFNVPSSGVVWLTMLNQISGKHFYHLTIH
jgi:ATP-binding cassette subfamily A (ABC1) protein 3